MPSIKCFLHVYFFSNITTNVAYLSVNARGEAYISFHFFVSYLEMANKVDITNNIFQMYRDVLCVKLHVLGCYTLIVKKK